MSDDRKRLALHSFKMETREEEIITEKTISPVFQSAINARGWIDYRAYEIQQELARVSVYYITYN